MEIRFSKLPKRAAVWTVAISAIFGAALLVHNRAWHPIPHAGDNDLVGALITLGVFLFDLALFLSPGFAVAALISRHRRLTPVNAVALVVATAAGLSYISFWAFFFSHLIGKLLSLATYSASAAILARTVLLRRSIRRTLMVAIQPFFYTALAGLAYVSFFFLFTSPITSDAFYADRRFFDELRPGDNAIPLILADRIYKREPVHPFCCGDWLSSDRPPLQTGAVLLERPLHLIHNSSLDYELLSVALQCFWICGIWCLLTALGAGDSTRRRILAFLIFSGFMFYNSVYTWPKLLAASCMLLALSIVVEVIRQRRIITGFECTLASVLIGSALLAHPGSLFSLVAAVVLTFHFRRFFPLRYGWVALAVVCVLLLPWSAYQKFVDPPGNRLLKMHLAGAMSVDGRSTWQAVRDAYTDYRLSEIVRFKWTNVMLLLGRRPMDTFGIDTLTSPRLARASNGSATQTSRIAQREWIWNAIGLANVGWLAGLLLIAVRSRRKKPLCYDISLRLSGWVVLAGLVNLITWCVVLFGPSATVTTHSSYTDILLVSVGLLGFILALPRFVYVSLFAVQLFNFFIVWVWSPPYVLSTVEPAITPKLQLPLMAMGGLFTVALIWILTSSGQRIPHHASETINEGPAISRDGSKEFAAVEQAGKEFE